MSEREENEQHEFPKSHHDEGCLCCGGFHSEPCEPPVPMKVPEVKSEIDFEVNTFVRDVCSVVPKLKSEVRRRLKELLSTQKQQTDDNWTTAIQYNCEPEQIERILGAYKEVE